MTTTHRTPDGFRIDSADPLTDEQARNLTFLVSTADLDLTRRFIELVDPGGTRIGEIGSITFWRHNPTLATVSLSLT